MLDLQKFKEILKNIPSKPGVYRFYSLSKELLYIGKAKNLKNRVSSYFQEGRPKNQRLTLMISQIEFVEYTVVDSEKESLILEANLIHKLQPKYNILLKDDKSYVYLRISNHPIPGIFIVRRKFDPRSKYFGPYTQRYGVVEILRTLRTIFPFCQEKTLQKRPCSYYHIKQCEGICIGLETNDHYQEKIRQIENILSGRTESAKKYISNQIHNAVLVNNFELAALWRDRLKILEEVLSNQKIVLPQPQDLDLITLVVKESVEGLQIGSIFFQQIRDGKMINVNNFLLSGTEEVDDENIERLNDLVTEKSIDNNLKPIILKFLQRFLTTYSLTYDGKTEVMVQVFYQKSES